MANFFGEIGTRVGDLVSHPVKISKDIVTNPKKGLGEMKDLYTHNTHKDQDLFQKGLGIKGWVGKHPQETAAAVVGTIFGGWAAAGGAGAGAGGAGAAGGSGALAGSAGGAAPITAAVGTPTAAGAAGSTGGAASAGSGSMFSSLMSNPSSMGMMSSMMGSTGTPAQPNPQGGTASLGGTGYQAYMYPGSSTQTAPSPQPTRSAALDISMNAPQAQSVAVGGQSPAPISAAVGEKVPEKKSFLQRMNESSSDQWDNFTGSGKYDTDNKANLDANGKLKTQGAMGFQDKMQAGFGLAATLMNGFDRR